MDSPVVLHSLKFKELLLAHVMRVGLHAAGKDLIVCLYLFHTRLQLLVHIYVQTLSLPQDVIPSGIHSIMQQIFVQEFEACTPRRHQELALRVPLSVLIKREPLIHNQVFNVDNTFTQFSNYVVLAKHFGVLVLY